MFRWLPSTAVTVHPSLRIYPRCNKSATRGVKKPPLAPRSTMWSVAASGAVSNALVIAKPYSPSAKVVLYTIQSVSLAMWRCTPECTVHLRSSHGNMKVRRRNRRKAGKSFLATLSIFTNAVSASRLLCESSLVTRLSCHANSRTIVRICCTKRSVENSSLRVER